jgi:anti-sigma B factor antagonist
MSSESAFQFAVSHAAGSTVVTLRGELDLATAPQLRDCLATLPPEGEIRVVLDLTHLEFIDSTGLSVLVLLFHRTQATGSSMVIRNPSSAVIRIFEITGLASVFTISTEGEPVPTAGG